ncbi:MAG: META domain-containing protein [Methanomicrobiales archaeon]|nr:META domain-containing protein [Methanomicrobiales archaeon]
MNPMPCAGMRALGIGCCLLACALICGCTSAPDMREPDMQTGTVIFLDLEGGFYGIAGDDGNNYLPLNLDPAFARDGMRVRFSYREEDVATIQQWGTPVTVLSMEPANGTPAAEPPGTGISELCGRNWELALMRDAKAELVAPLNGTTISAVFTDDGSLSGSAGCNHYTAAYFGGRGDIVIGPAAVTEMYCISPEGVMAQEALFLERLGGVQAYAMNSSTLELSGADGRLLLAFREA